MGGVCCGKQNVNQKTYRVQIGNPIQNPPNQPEDQGFNDTNHSKYRDKKHKKS